MPKSYYAYKLAGYLICWGIVLALLMIEYLLNIPITKDVWGINILIVAFLLFSVGTPLAYKKLNTIAKEQAERRQKGL